MYDSHTRAAARWAPWPASAIPIGALNLLRQLLVPPAEVGDAVSIALFAGTVTIVAAVVTAFDRGRRAGRATAPA